MPAYLCLVSFDDFHIHLNLSPKLLKCFWPLLSFQVSLMDRLANFLHRGRMSTLVSPIKTEETRIIPNTLSVIG